MSHQPFDSWLLDPESLTTEQAAQLRAHLADCKECAQLRTAWQEVAAQLKSEPVVAPSPGFTSRWKSSLEERKAKQRARQIRRTFFLMIGGIALLSLALLVSILVTSTPADILVSIIRLFTETASTLTDVQQFFQFLLRVAPPGVPIFLGLALISWLVIISLTWMLTLLRFSFRGERNQ